MPSVLQTGVATVTKENHECLPNHTKHTSLTVLRARPLVGPVYSHSNSLMSHMHM